MYGHVKYARKTGAMSAHLSVQIVGSGFVILAVLTSVDNIMI